MTFITSRSNVIAYQTCPRKRYLSYHHNGMGIQSDRLNSNLFIGSVTHRGLEYLLEVAKQYEQNMGDILVCGQVDKAVEVALQEFDEGIQQSQFDDQGDPNFLYFEYRSLVEALIRVYAKVQLPRLLKEFEVLEVEKELEFELSPNSYRKCNVHTHTRTSGEEFGPCDSCGDTGQVSNNDSIIFLSRPDAILRRKSDGGIFVLSFKTSASYDAKVNDLQNKYDMQGISETVAVERWLDQQLQDQIREQYKGEDTYIGQPLAIYRTPKVSGVKMEFLIKGSKIGIGQNKGWINNFLIHPWRNETTGELSHVYEWKDDFDGKTKRLGKGWSRCSIWELGEKALEEWIDFLGENHLRLLEGLVICPEPYNRNETDINDWIEATTAQEIRIRNSLERIPAYAANETMDTFLNVEFQKHRGSCFHYNHQCQFWQSCWLGLSLECAEYKPREVNHPRELELIQIQGKSE